MADNAAAQHALLLKQASEREKKGEFREAVSDLRRALQLVKDDPPLRTQTADAISMLLKRIGELKDRENSVSLLLKETLCDDDWTAESLPRRIEVAKRVAAWLSNDRANSIEQSDVQRLMDLIVTIVDKVESGRAIEKESGQLTVLCGILVSILSTYVETKEGALFVSRTFRQVHLLALVSLKEKLLPVASRSFDMIAKLCVTLGSSWLASEVADDILNLFSDCMKLGCNDKLRKASLANLTKICSTPEVALATILHAQLLKSMFRMTDTTRLDTSSDGEMWNSLVAIALSRVVEQIESGAKQDQIKEAKAKIAMCVLELLGSGNSDERTHGLLALSCLFSVNTTYAKDILLRESQIQDILIDMVEFEPIYVQVAALNMLNAACAADEDCRKAVSSTECTTVLTKLWKQTSNANLRQAASSLLVKVLNANKELEKRLLQDNELVNSFIRCVKDNASAAESVANAVESLAYLSLRPPVKALLAEEAFVKSVLKLLNGCENRAVLYGVVTILTNVTNLRRRLTEEEEQLMKLKEVAGEAVTKPDPLDDDSVVEQRCSALVHFGVVPPICALSSSCTPALASIVGQLLLNLCNDKKNRGRIVQEGGIKALTSIASKLGSTKENQGYLFAAQALAKITITTDPHLAFRPASKALDLVRPLINLLQADSLLQNFEGLMALTNLASFDETVRRKIVSQKGISTMEWLQMNENVLVRRAATECLCNMMVEEDVFRQYAASESKIRLLTALSDSEDLGTQIAASGALAMLSSSEVVCASGWIKLEVIATLVESDDESLNLRGLEIARNLCSVDAHRTKLHAAGAEIALRRILSGPKNAQVKSSAAAVLQVMTGYDNDLTDEPDID